MSDWQLFEPLAEAEYEVLKRDIEKRGVLVPIEVDEQGEILDGHHRLRACEELGIPDPPIVTRTFTNDVERRLHVIALNTCRRHLSSRRKHRWINEFDQLTLPIEVLKARQEQAEKVRPISSAPKAATERQRYHRLREKIRPQEPVSAFTDPWELAADIIDALIRVRQSLGANPGALAELEAAVEMVKQLAWGPEK